MRTTLLPFIIDDPQNTACSSCLSFGFLDYRPGIPHCLFHLTETEADKPFCDDWRPKLGNL